MLKSTSINEMRGMQQSTVTKGKTSLAVRVLAGLFALASLAMPLGFNPIALATPPVSHDAATCADLQTLGADNSTRNDTINLTADIDCTGVSFVPMYSAGFAGTMDGHGHSISHLVINQPGNSFNGLFTGSDDATVQNLTLASGSVTGAGSTGALIGEADGALTVHNVTSSLDVTANGNNAGSLIGIINNSTTIDIQDVTLTGHVTDTASSLTGYYVGGLVGYFSAIGSTVTIRRVSDTGSVSGANSYVGGLIGHLITYANSSANSVTIEDSYSSGSVSTSSGQRVGGLAGDIQVTDNGPTNTVTVSRVYASGAQTGTQEVGGLIGYAAVGSANSTFTIDHSFATGTVATTATSGGLVGNNGSSGGQNITSTANYYDGPGTGQNVCATTLAMTGSCTRIDTGPQPNYFKGNHANAPLNNWDFASVWWSSGPTAYPALIPLTDGDAADLATEAGAPNGGDGNNDGASDAAQPNVTDVVDGVSGHYVTVAANSSCINTAVSTAPESANAAQDVGYNYTAGFVDLTTNCTTPGVTATLNLYFFGVTGTNLVARKYNATTHGYSSIPGATVTQLTIGGQAVTKVTYQITDGGALDADGTANGIIVDPVGLGAAVVSVPNTGVGALAGGIH